jgi:PTH1 family peptidyl-tRNA hydrolase
VAAGRVGNAPVRLVRPLTYMNLSGTVLRPYRRREGWSPVTDLLVVVDDVALPVGALRLRARGSHGGHNGLRSIEHALGTREYARLRIGIKPVETERAIGDLADFVLSPFGTHERALVLALLPTCADAVALWLSDGIGQAMNRFNASLRV